MGKDTIVEVLPGKNVRLRGRFSQYDDYVPYELEESNFEEEAANYGRGYGAGWAGMPGDFNEMVGGLVQGGVTALQKAPEVQGLMGYLGAKAHQYAPATTEDVGRHWGADVESPEFQAGTYGLPGLEDVALQGGKGLAALFLHGSPHRFNKFDLSRIGTGEGAQAKGWGLYFAENPKVAGQYRDELSDGFEIDGQFFQAATTRSSDTAGNVAADALKRFDGDKQKAIDWLEDFGREGEAKEILLSAKEIKPFEGHLYEVDIPDEVAGQMLDWDAPLSEQPEKVRSAFEEYFEVEGGMTGRDAYEALGDFFDDGDRGASMALAREGIPGIRFYDAGSRNLVGGRIMEVENKAGKFRAKVEIPNNTRAQGAPQTITWSPPFNTEAEARKWADQKIAKGTRNIVVFDPDSAIKQVKRDGELVYEAEKQSKLAKALSGVSP